MQVGTSRRQGEGQGTTIILKGIIIENMATILSIIIAVIIYILAISCLKIFSKEEIFLLPYGEKIFKIMEKIGIY